MKNAQPDKEQEKMRLYLLQVFKLKNKTSYYLASSSLHAKAYDFDNAQQNEEEMIGQGVKRLRNACGILIKDAFLVSIILQDFTLLDYHKESLQANIQTLWIEPLKVRFFNINTRGISLKTYVIYCSVSGRSF